ncbi:MAG: hypothetical protein H6Q89_3759, partial [Myxococcaceae bacterium]|nr:hypothetical protein [Myxococcaceae bacterium]
TGSAVQLGSIALTVGNATVSGLGFNFTGSPTTQAIVSISQCSDFNCGGGQGGTPSHDFGFAPVGSTNPVMLFVRNTGSSPATLSNTGLSGPGYAYSTGSYPGGAPGSQVNWGGQSFNFCPASPGTLAPGARCVISVDWSASGTVTQNGSLALGLTGATTPGLAFNFSGTPTTLAIVSISTCSNCGGGGGPGTPMHDFGYVPNAGTRSSYFFVRNRGTSPAALTNSAVTGAGFSYTQGNWPGGQPGAQVMVDGQNWNLCPALGASLPGGATCVVSVTYSATGTMPQAGNLSITLGGATTPGLSLDLRGTPTMLAIVSLSDGPWGGGGCCGTPTHDFGTVPSPSTNTTLFYLSNTGATGATLISASLTGGAFSHTGGTFPGGVAGSTIMTWSGPVEFCPMAGGTLAPGASCVFQVTYSATGTAPQAGSLTLNLGNATDSSLGYALTGSPTTAAIVSMTTCPNCGGGGGGQGLPTHDFGVVAVASTNPQFFFVHNAGIGSATLSSGVITGAGFAWAGTGYPGGTPLSTVNVQGNNYTYCPAPGGLLASQATCVIQLVYSASGSNPQNGNVTLNLANATAPSVGFNLAGTPTSSAIVRISTCVGCGSNNPFDYGTAGTSLDVVFVAQNTGLMNAGLADGNTLSPPFFFSSGSYPGGTGTTNVFGQTVSFCGSALAPGASCALSVRFSGATSGSSTLTLNLTGAFSPTASQTVLGTATTRALLRISDGEGLFGCTDTTCGNNPAQLGPVTSPATIVREFLVTNYGAQPTFNILGGNPFGPYFGFAGSGSFPGGTGAKQFNGGATYPYCGVVIAPGASCLVSVDFHPPTGPGTYNSNLNLQYFDGSGQIIPNANRMLRGLAN